jgi:hypothetical protein
MIGEQIRRKEKGKLPIFEHKLQYMKIARGLKGGLQRNHLR